MRARSKSDSKSYSASSYAWKILKRSYISTVGSTVHTSLSLVCFYKTLFKSEEIENAGFAFQFGRKTFDAFLEENLCIQIAQAPCGPLAAR